jgi:threonine dehydrogenase-like Zn-dependent dehydrogenase
LPQGSLDALARRVLRIGAHSNILGSRWEDPVKACIKTANGKVEMMDIATPEPKAGEIIVKMGMATVCGSDMHFLDEFANEMLAFAFPGSVTEHGLPMGHEGVGVVSAVGEGVTKFREGDRILTSCMLGCGKCHECQHVDHSVCSGGGRVMFGCQAEYYAVPFADQNATTVPDGVSDEHAVLISDILSTGFGAIERADAGFGHSVAVFAQGPVGLMATAGARARGCGMVIAVDTLPDRLEVSKEFGANVTINAKEKDPVAEIMALTGGGVDIAVEAVGTQATFEAATKCVRRGGTVSSVGVYGLTPQVSMPTLTPSFLHRNIVTTLCPSGSDRMAYLCNLMAHSNIDLSPVFTHRMTLDEMPQAYDLFRSKTEGVLKIAITP